MLTVSSLQFTIRSAFIPRQPASQYCSVPSLPIFTFILAKKGSFSYRNLELIYRPNIHFVLSAKFACLCSVLYAYILLLGHVWSTWSTVNVHHIYTVHIYCIYIMFNMNWTLTTLTYDLDLRPWPSWTLCHNDMKDHLVGKTHWHTHMADRHDHKVVSKAKFNYAIQLANQLARWFSS